MAEGDQRLSVETGDKPLYFFVTSLLKTDDPRFHTRGIGWIRQTEPVRRVPWCRTCDNYIRPYDSGSRMHDGELGCVKLEHDVGDGFIVVP